VAEAVEGNGAQPRLILQRGDEQPTTFPLVLRETLIGRIDSNHLMLDHPTVSRVHARIIVVNDWVEIEDCGSSLGTLVNGHIVDRARLRDGDVISLGHVSITYAE